MSCSLSGASGYHNVYLVFTGGSGYLFNLEWFNFIGSGGNQPAIVLEPPPSTSPPLSIHLASGTKGLILQWPDNGSPTSPSLYYTPNFEPPVTWTLLTNIPVLSNTQWSSPSRATWTPGSTGWAFPTNLWTGGTFRPSPASESGNNETVILLLILRVHWRFGHGGDRTIAQNGIAQGAP